MSNDYITIVSGLPRAGTSMMMRMLLSGGMEILTDNERKADENNPRGYFELEKVKKVKEDASWLSGARGKAFKMVSQLLFHLPASNEYRIIFMQRKMEEVLASQKKMLKSTGANPGNVSDAEMAALFGKHLKQVQDWLTMQGHIQVLYVNYNDVIKEPLENAERVNRFLDGRLNVNGMVEAIEPALYRQRM